MSLEATRAGRPAVGVGRGSSARRCRPGARELRLCLMARMRRTNGLACVFGCSSRADATAWALAARWRCWACSPQCWPLWQVRASVADTLHMEHGCAPFTRGTPVRTVSTGPERVCVPLLRSRFRRLWAFHGLPAALLDTVPGEPWPDARDSPLKPQWRALPCSAPPLRPPHPPLLAASSGSSRAAPLSNACRAPGCPAQVLPYILLGVSIDLMFILTKAYDELVGDAPEMSLESRMRKLMGAAGADLQGPNPHPRQLQAATALRSSLLPAQPS